MRKFWVIKGTDHHGVNKEELKKIRTTLNKEAKVDEKTAPASTWPYKISKGPDHPHNKPFFREFPLNSFFEVNGFIYKKVSEHEGKLFEDGVLGTTSRKFPAEQQVHFVS